MSVFDFSNFQDYLNGLKNHFPGRKKPLTLGQFAKLLGFQSPRTIAMLLNGQRRPSRFLGDKLARLLQLPPNESMYLETLTKLASERLDQVERQALETKLRMLRPKSFRTNSTDKEITKFFSAWYLPVLRQLISDSKTPDNIAWIFEKLKKRISTTDLEKGIKILKELGIIESKGGKLCTIKGARFVSPFDVPSQPIQNHHIEMMKRAEESLSDESVHDREFLSITFKSKAIKEIKLELREFLLGLSQKYHDEETSQIVQLNGQFFRHSHED